MIEEKKEVESSEEDEIKSLEEEETSEEEKSEEESEGGFEKKEEFVSTNKYNQAVRKQREIELEKRELEKQLAEAKKLSSVAEKTSDTDGVKGKPKKEDEDFLDDIADEDEVKVEEKKQIPQEDPSKLIDEKLKPVLETLKKREEDDRRKSRAAFFDAHPEYATDSEKWNGLLDELDKSINPNSGDDYFEQLNKAHILYTGQKVEDIEIETKKREMASDATSGGSGAQKATAKEEFTSEDRKYMKEWGISEEGMKAYKEKLKSGSMRILS